MNDMPSTARSIVLAIAVALAGWWIGGGFVRARTADRYVTVKGVAERIVSADMGVWPLRFVATDDVLTAAQARIEAQRQGVFEILPRDQAPGIMEGSQLERTLRVVSTVEYYLMH